MIRASRNLQIGDRVTTDFNRAWSEHVIIERKEPAVTSSRIAFKVEPIVKGSTGDWMDAGWFEAAPSHTTNKEK
jgi:hypothetical protein